MRYIHLGSILRHHTHFTGNLVSNGFPHRQPLTHTSCYPDHASILVFIRCNHCSVLGHLLKLNDKLVRDSRTCAAYRSARDSLSPHKHFFLDRYCVSRMSRHSLVMRLPLSTRRSLWDLSESLKVSYC